MARPARRHPLAQPSTPLIGRDDQVGRVRDLLIGRRHRLLTCTGPGGTGKTRLATAVAASVAEEFPDGVWLVDLSSLSDSHLVTPSIARVLSLEETRESPLLEHLKEHLHDRQLLLVLDNFEQVIQAANDLAELLASCPRVQILVTSRAALRLSWEQEVPVPPLDVPDLSRDADVAAIIQSPAVTLFVERARAVCPDFAVDRLNARTVAEVCVRLDGLPLALELAAARTKMLTPAAILARLEERFALLTRGAQDWPARHRTMRSAIGWSYDLLEPQEQALFRRLAVFSGGCSLPAATAICGAEYGQEMDVLEGISALVDHSLIRRQEQSGGEPRFGALETIRAFALERLQEAGELEEYRERHSTYFLSVAVAAEPELWGTSQAAWLERLERERDNLRAALRWTTRIDGDDVETALRLVGALWRFWSLHGHLREGREWVTKALALERPAQPAVRAQALKAAGNLERAWGDYPAARDHYAMSLEICRDRSDLRGVATILSNLGNLAYDQGDFVAAHGLWEESRRHRQELGDRRGVALLLNKLGNCASAQSDYAAARGHHQESYTRFRELDDAWGMAIALDDLGVCALLVNDLEGARRFHEDSLARFQKLGDAWGIAHALKNLGRVSLAQGDIQRAAEFFHVSLGHFHDIGEKHLVAIALGDLARVALAQGHLPLAARLLGASDGVRESTASSLAAPDAAAFDGAIAAARRAMPAQSFHAEWTAGRAMRLEKAVELALIGSAQTSPAGSPLTPRENEVARLVARGMTNRQIADELVITERTAETHLERIFSKLDLRSRSQLTRWVMEREPALGTRDADSPNSTPPRR